MTWMYFQIISVLYLGLGISCQSYENDMKLNPSGIANQEELRIPDDDDEAVILFDIDASKAVKNIDEEAALLQGDRDAKSEEMPFIETSPLDEDADSPASDEYEDGTKKRRKRTVR